MKIKVLTFIILPFLLQSCVPYKKVVYMQGDLPQNRIDNALYKIQPGDILYINIKSGNETIQRLFSIQGKAVSTGQNMASSLYFNGYTVDHKGFVELPVLGKILVADQTFKMVKNRIKQKLLSTQFKSLDDIFIKIKLAGVPYTVLGEVKQPGMGVLYKENPNLFDVLSDAKDITQVGNRKAVVVVRKEQNKVVKKVLDLTRAEVFHSPYFYVRPNDIIYVQPLRQKTWGTGATLQQTISTTITALSLITTIILLSKYAK